MFTSLCGLGDALLVTKQQHPLQNSHFRSRVGQHTARYFYVQLGEHLTSATFQISTVTAAFSFIMPKLCCMRIVR